MLKNNGILSRKLIGTFGEIEFSRTSLIPADKVSAARLMELENVKSIFPLDVALGIDVLPFKITYSMMCAIAKEAVRARSYVDASENIAEKFHLEINPVQVERVTDYIGNIVFKEQQHAAEEALLAAETKVDGRLRHRRKNDILYLEMDGAMVHIRDKNDGDGWMESKHAIAFHSSKIHYYTSEDGSVKNHRILEREFVGYIGSAAEFKTHFLSLAKRNGYDICTETVVITDGAKWIHSFVEELVPRATHILDLYHAKENAGKFAQTVKRGKIQKKKYADELCKLIDEGNIDGLLKAIEPHKNDKLPPGIPNLYSYVENNRNFMDYPTYREKGYFVGSGAIESGNIRLMQNRMKLQGMRWKLSNARCMLSLKAKYESGRWDDVINLVYKHLYEK